VPDDGSGVRLLAQSDAVAARLRALASGREPFGDHVDVAVVEGPPADTVARLRGAGVAAPLGMVADDEAHAFAAIAAGADDGCVADGLDAPRFVALLDRVTLRARQRRETENRLAMAAHAEKLAALGTVVAGVAHEINNPLSVIVLALDGLRSALEPLLQAQDAVFRLAARGGPANAAEIVRLGEVARTGASAGELRAGLDDAEAALQTITEVVRDLRIFARSENDDRTEPVYLPDLVDHVLRVVGKQITSTGTLERDYGTDVPWLLLPRSRLTQVLTNLLVNAAHAIADIRRAVHRVRVSIRCDSEALALSISDSGPGIPGDIVERIFDPFFTTKRPEGGTGLGLSISRSILRALNGDLIAESVHGEGATFIALIPLEGRRVVHPMQAPPPRAGSSPASRSSVLVVEDEEPLLRSIAGALRQRFHVILAADGQEALDLLTSGSSPDVVLCDLGLPYVDGRRLYEWLVRNRPELSRRTLFMTASAADGTRFAEEFARPVLEKPVTRARLLSALDRLLAE
jgi:signal transduction histidine kinase/CheY-like chemotaxis protein